MIEKPRSEKTMPKRIKDKNKSIFVKFYSSVNEEEIHSFLNSLKVTGTRVSSLINRWAIEVPFWKEDFFVKKFQENESVELVHESFDRKVNRTRFNDEEGEDTDSE